MLVVGLAASLLSSGCVHRRVYVTTTQSVGPSTPDEVVVAQTPPPPAVEGISPSPGPTYVWVPGYWAWQGRWVWVRGEWFLPPRPRAAWVPGHWNHHHRGYVWVPGHWR